MDRYCGTKTRDSTRVCSWHPTSGSHRPRLGLGLKPPGTTGRQHHHPNIHPRISNRRLVCKRHSCPARLIIFLSVPVGSSPKCSENLMTGASSRPRQAKSQTIPLMTTEMSSEQLRILGMDGKPLHAVASAAPTDCACGGPLRLGDLEGVNHNATGSLRDILLCEHV